MTNWAGALQACPQPTAVRTAVAKPGTTTTRADRGLGVAVSVARVLARFHPHRPPLPGGALRHPGGQRRKYMPQLNVLCALGDYSAQSDQPLMKHQLVTVTRSVKDDE